MHWRKPVPEDFSITHCVKTLGTSDQAENVEHTGLRVEMRLVQICVLVPLGNSSLLLVFPSGDKVSLYSLGWTELLPQLPECWDNRWVIMAGCFHLFPQLVVRVNILSKE